MFAGVIIKGRNVRLVAGVRISGSEQKCTGFAHRASKLAVFTRTFSEVFTRGQLTLHSDSYCIPVHAGTRTQPCVQGKQALGYTEV